MTAWIYLVIAGLLEVCWAMGLKYTEGFTKPIPTIFTIAAIIASMWMLGLATKDMPIGTAYAVWVGIGATGAAIFGSMFLHEPITAGRMVFLGLLVVSIVGLKLTAPPHGEEAPTQAMVLAEG